MSAPVWSRKKMATARINRRCLPALMLYLCLIPIGGTKHESITNISPKTTYRLSQPNNP